VGQSSETGIHELAKLEKRGTWAGVTLSERVSSCQPAPPALKGFWFEPKA
jgi:hypothetical protein